MVLFVITDLFAGRDALAIVAFAVLLASLLCMAGHLCLSKQYTKMNAKAGMGELGHHVVIGPEEDRPYATPTADPAPDAVKQTYDAYLVLDVEATCVGGGTDFSYPNEIIEWPVCLLRWKDKDAETGAASALEVVAEFRSFVRPTYQPELSDFCKELTGIQQDAVDGAPEFTQVLIRFRQFLLDEGLLEPSGRAACRFCWCSDGPFDFTHFLVKQCFIAKTDMPSWIGRDIVDVRLLTAEYLDGRKHASDSKPQSLFPVRRMRLGIHDQLRVLELSEFQGRHHSGIDDARNIARILIELARRRVRIVPNTSVDPKRRWPWMGKKGQILEEHVRRS